MEEGEAVKIFPTWWGSTAHAMLVDVLHVEPDEPGAEGDVLVGVPVQYRPENEAAAPLIPTE